MFSDNAKKIFNMKYAKEKPNGEKETWLETCARVANYIATAETVEANYKEVVKLFFDVMYSRTFIPGGRILSNAGTKIPNLMNCFILPLEDSRQGIYTALTKAAEIFAWGGGIGYNFSNLREKGASVNSTGGTASGPISFMSLFDQTGEVISQASRRGAQMGILNITHPDVISFINIKNDLNSRNKRLMIEYLRNLKTAGLDRDGEDYFCVMQKTLADDQLTHFNISIGITDEFMIAVKEDADWYFTKSNGEKIKSELTARELLLLIAKNAWQNGDPGLFFLDRANQDNMVPYLGDISATNPCLHPDTLLLDGDKLRRISDVGDTWVSWKSGYKQVIKLTTNAGHEIILTPDHKIQLETGFFIEAKDSVGKSIKWALGNRKPMFRLEKYELLGFLFGKGAISKDNTAVEVKLSTRENTQVADLLLRNGFHSEDKTSFYSNRSSILNIQFLNQNYYDRVIPENILTGDSDKVASFLRGLFEAIGSCRKNNQISLTAISKRLALDIQILLASFGIQSWIYQTKNNDYMLQMTPANSHKFMAEIGILSANNLSKIKFSGKNYDKKLKVESIEPLGLSDVWDFSIENHYNLANGIIAHNCGEIPLLNYEPCCLGSLNLKNMTYFHDNNYHIDWDYLRDTIWIAVRFLDNVHSMSFTPIREINDAARKTRRLGLGVMGLADLLASMGIPYDSDLAFELSDSLARFIGKESWKASQALAEEKGAFEAFDEKGVNWSLLDKFNLEHKPVRNVAVTGIAPTGSIALIADVNSGIEPFFAKKLIRNITEGVGNIAKDSVEQSIVFTDVKTAHQISFMDHIEIQSIWQNWVDNAVSKTINMSNSASVEDVFNAFIDAYEKGLKGITIYRDGSKLFQILNSED